MTNNNPFFPLHFFYHTGNSAEDIGYLHQHKETTQLLNMDGPGGVLERFAKFDL